MKQIVLHLKKNNLILGVILAIILIIYLKKYATHRLESFLTLRPLLSLCNKKYTAPTKPQETIPPKKVDTIQKSIPPKKVDTIQERIPPKKVDTNVDAKCKLGILINPPPKNVIDAIENLTPISNTDIYTVEQQLLEIPEFINIIESIDKEKVIKEIIILNNILKAPPTNLTYDQIQKIAINILADINTIDPQIASLAAIFYSNTDTTYEVNPFANLNIPTTEINLNTNAINIILSEPIKELSPEGLKTITGTLSEIKIFMPYEECEAILTRNIK